MSSLQEGKIPQIQNLDKLIPADLLKNLPPANEVLKTLTPLIETAAKIAKNTDFSKVGFRFQGFRTWGEMLRPCKNQGRHRGSG